MLKEILFMGYREFGEIRPNEDTVVISILDPSEEHRRPEGLYLFRDALELHFVDVNEPKGAPPWPDVMTEEQHLAACVMHECKAPQIDDAQRIVEFTRRHHEVSEELTLVVHCFAGVSRSAAVARWASMTYGAELPQVNEGLRGVDQANPRVLRLLKRAYAMQST